MTGTSVISDCERYCSHYWLCKIREQYEEVIKKERQIKIDFEIPDFVQTVTSMSLICKHQDYKEPKNTKYGVCVYCGDCVHKEVCDQREDFIKLCDMLKDSKVRINASCPDYKTKVVKEIK